MHYKQELENTKKEQERRMAELHKRKMERADKAIRYIRRILEILDEEQNNE